MKNRIFKFLGYLMLLTYIFSWEVYSKEKNIFLNPGVRLSYTFGKNGGFTTGFEISCTYLDLESPIIWGILISVDSRRSFNKIHLGVEVVSPRITRTIGISIGPTMTKDNNITDYGFTSTVFGGVIIYPFYAYTWRANSQDIHEMGAFLKLHMHIYGKIDIRFGH